MIKSKKANINWRRYFRSLEVTVLSKRAGMIESNTKTIGYCMGNVIAVQKAADYIDVYSN
jgi:hypothetical protein